MRRAVVAVVFTFAGVFFGSPVHAEQPLELHIAPGGANLAVIRCVHGQGVHHMVTSEVSGRVHLGDDSTSVTVTVDLRSLPARPHTLDGYLLVTEAQMEGKRAASGVDLVNGLWVKVGDVFGEEKSELGS